MTWRQLRDCLSGAHRSKPLTVIVDWLYSEVDSLEESNNKCSLTVSSGRCPSVTAAMPNADWWKLLHQVLVQREAAASKAGSLRRNNSASIEKVDTQRIHRSARAVCRAQGKGAWPFSTRGW